MRLRSTVLTLLLAVFLTPAFSAPHSVTLNWNPVTSAAKYSVYRAEVSTGPYTKIGDVTTPHYVDLAVVIAHKYFYVVTTVDASGKESAFSSEVSGLIRPSAPTTLTPKVN